MMAGAAGHIPVRGASAASWDGTAWTPITVTNSFNDVILQSVSCVGMSLCMADGTGGPNGNHAIVDSWSGAGGWTQDTVPTLPGQGKLFGISCISSTSCTAVGRIRRQNAPSTLVFTWNGLAWSQPSNTPDAAGSP